MNSLPTTRVLFLAPQPFFSERGTPIAVFLAVSTIASRSNTSVDLLTLKGSRSINLPNVHHHTIELPKFIGEISPGISLKKIFADFLFLFATLRMILSQPRYDLIHAVEEAGFIAWLLFKLFKIPYVYDMDSQLSTQVCEKWRWLSPIGKVLGWLEGLVIRSACAVVAVCPALVKVAKAGGASRNLLLQDVSLLDQPHLFEEISNQQLSNLNLRNSCKISSEHVLVLYVGNLEVYQGVDLLLDSMERLRESHTLAHLAIIGGSSSQIKKYQSKIDRMGISNQVSFLGPYPLGYLSQLLVQADIVASPRIEGVNTPMKIYSYLDCGRALIATRLETHTQVLNDQIAYLVDPDVNSFSKGLAVLVEDTALREKLSSSAKLFAQQNCTFASFNRTLNKYYDEILTQIKADMSLQAA